METVSSEMELETGWDVPFEDEDEIADEIAEEKLKVDMKTE